MNFFRSKLSSKYLNERLLATTFLFLALFISTVIISYNFLPPGLLRRKNPLHNWDTSRNIIILSLQIFFYNIISVIVIILGSLFANKKNTKEKNYLSVGYTAFFTIIFINGIVLGTWSFSIERNPVPLFERLVYTFDIVHKAGLWEMIGQLFITCAFAHFSFIRYYKKETVIRSFRDIHLSFGEILTIILGLSLMLMGAFIESLSILSPFYKLK